MAGVEDLLEGAVDPHGVHEIAPRRMQVETWGIAMARIVIMSTSLNMLNANGISF